MTRQIHGYTNTYTDTLIHRYRHMKTQTQTHGDTDIDTDTWIHKHRQTQTWT